MPSFSHASMELLPDLTQAGCAFAQPLLVLTS